MNKSLQSHWIAT